jgi:hypothetical protein
VDEAAVAAASEVGEKGFPLPRVKRLDRRGVCAEERRVCCDERGSAATAAAGEKSTASARAVSSERVRRWEAAVDARRRRRFRMRRKRRRPAVRRERVPKTVPSAMPIMRRFWKEAVEADVEGEIAVTAGEIDGDDMVANVVGT